MWKIFKLTQSVGMKTIKFIFGQNLKPQENLEKLLFLEIFLMSLCNVNRPLIWCDCFGVKLITLTDLPKIRKLLGI